MINDDDIIYFENVEGHLGIRLEVLFILIIFMLLLLFSYCFSISETDDFLS